MFLPKHVVCNIWYKQTQLFKYSVNSTMLFSKSLWTHFIRLTFFDKFDVAHGVRRVPTLSLILRSLLGTVSAYPPINLGSLDIFSIPSPLLAKIGTPGLTNLKHRWLNTVMVWNAYLSKIQTETDKHNNKTSNSQAMSQKF